MARITDSLAAPKALLAPVAALLVGVALLMLGNGLFLTLVPLRADLEGFGAAWIGVIGAAYSVGFVAGCYLVPPLVARVGHIRVYAAIAALGAIVPLLHLLALHPAAWILFRIIIGLCISGLYMVIESWLNGAATRRNRGTVFSAYVAIHLAAVTAGQYLLLLDTPSSSKLFSLATILFALGVIPVCLTRAPSPPLPVKARPDLRKLWRNSQVSVVGCFTNGMANGAVWSLVPVYAKGLGLSVAGIAIFVSVAIVGGAVVQYPLGRLSDRLPDRRWLIAAVCAVAAAAGAVLLAADSLPALFVYVAYFFFGAAAFSIYGFSVAHANDHADPEDFVEISAGLLVIFGVGAVAGPLIAAALMEALGSGYLFLFTGVVHGAVALWTFRRTKQRRAIAPEDREDYVPMARTSPNIFAFDPRAEETPPDRGG
ncbi:MAG: MFS transporter [Rhodospirillaceae bacterium]|nr:MFS transporter [Rhodospirillaceae bacterium]MDE0617172.1 MFS transporter [Rhodospirillaceae bacterium]